MKKLVFILCAALFTPVAARAQAVAGSCERNAAMAQTLSDNGGPYLAPICLGSPGSTDAPVDRATHAKSDVTRMGRCPPGVSGAACFQRRSEVLAYACENGAQPDVKLGAMSKTPDGCEADRADKTGRAGNCKIFFCASVANFVSSSTAARGCR
jgi:hypothetical protein